MRRFSLLFPLLFWACGEDPTPPLADAGAFDAGFVDAGPSDAGGVVVGGLVLSADRADFGRVVVGSTAELSLSLSNPGLKPLSVTLSAPAGADAASFTAVVNVPAPGGAFTLEAGGLARVTVTIKPEAAQVLAATLAIDSCEGTCPATITLSGEGVLSGLECPVMLDFGQVNLEDCRSQSLTCFNRANVPERLTAVELDPGSDPAYRLQAPTLPLELAPTSSTTFQLRFCPTVGGAASGELVLVSFLPFDSELRIPLSARGGGADLRCTPDPLDFQQVGVGATVSSAFHCENAGTDAALITASLASAGEFALAGSPVTEIPAGGAKLLEVAFSPSSVGVKQDTLRIDSNDPDQPRLELGVQGTAIDVGPCVATVYPSTLDFGLVAVGDARTVPVSIHNGGSDPCLIRALGFAPNSSATLTLARSLSVGAAIGAGETKHIEIRFAPTVNSVISGQALVSFSNPGTTELNVEIDGTGGGAPIVPEPAALDFGRAPITCAQPLSRRVQLHWVAAAAGTISNVQVASTDGAFSLGPNTTVPSDLSLDQRLEVEVLFSPTTVGAHVATLRVFAGGATTPILVPLFGEGGGDSARSDTFVDTVPKVDVLFVVDDSATMGLGQKALASGMPTFAQALQARGADVHVAFVTTDMEEPTRQGQFYGTPTVLNSNTPDLEAQLVARSLPGISGSGNETALLAAVTALSEPLASGVNQGFLRPDADLAIVIISEEDEQSPSPPTISQHLVALRQASGTGVLLVSGLVGAPDGECTGPAGTALSSPRYSQLFGLAGGRGGLYCQDMSLGLAEIAGQALGASSYVLSGAPAVGSIQVQVNGTALPERTGNQRNWAFELATNRVVLLGSNLVPAQATVQIDYQLYCVSPTCGNGTVEAGEECDLVSDPSCFQCFDNVCGDGHVGTGETCDDGNLANGDACIVCQAARCGDGFVQAGVETCDDGNTQSGDGCPSTCRFYTPSGLSSAAFTELVNGTSIPFTGAEDDGTYSMEMPFAFNFFDVPTTSISISVNGFVSFTPIDVASSYQNDPIPDTNLPNGIIAPWWDDLLLDTAIPGGASISWAVEGVAPDRSLVIEWRDVRVVDHSTQNHRRFTFQTALYEDGRIELRYGGTETTGGPPTASSASAGIEDEVGGRGYEALGCSPACDGRPRPPRADGFPSDAIVTITP